MKKSQKITIQGNAREQNLEKFKFRLLVDTPNKKNSNSPSRIGNNSFIS